MLFAVMSIAQLDYSQRQYLFKRLCFSVQEESLQNNKKRIYRKRKHRQIAQQQGASLSSSQTSHFNDVVDSLQPDMYSSDEEGLSPVSTFRLYSCSFLKIATTSVSTLSFVIRQLNISRLLYEISWI